MTWRLVIPVSLVVCPLVVAYLNNLEKSRKPQQRVKISRSIACLLALQAMLGISNVFVANQASKAEAGEIEYNRDTRIEWGTPIGHLPTAGRRYYADVPVKVRGNPAENLRNYAKVVWLPGEPNESQIEAAKSVVQPIASKTESSGDGQSVKRDGVYHVGGMSDDPLTESQVSSWKRQESQIYLVIAIDWKNVNGTTSSDSTCARLSGVQWSRLTGWVNEWSRCAPIAGYPEEKDFPK